MQAGALRGYCLAGLEVRKEGSCSVGSFWDLNGTSMPGYLPLPGPPGLTLPLHSPFPVGELSWSFWGLVVLSPLALHSQVSFLGAPWLKTLSFLERSQGDCTLPQTCPSPLSFQVPLQDGYRPEVACMEDFGSASFPAWAAVHHHLLSVPPSHLVG